VTTVIGAVLNEPGQAVAFEELELEPPGPGEVEVRIEASGVCHSDLHIQRTEGWGMRFPILLGHEGAGRVERVGEGVESPKPGDYVVLGWRSPCGTCPPCLRGEPRRCRSPLRAKRRLHRKRDGAALSQALLCGTFAPRTIVHAGAAIPVPEELPPEQACLLACAVATGVGAVRTTSPVRPGARVAVLGCGGVGLSAIQGARIAGAAEIVAIDVAPARLEWAGRFGATQLVDAGTADLADVEPVDFAYEAAGRAETLEQAVRLLAYDGTATMIGLPRPGARISLDLKDDLFDRRATLRVSFGGDHLPAEDFPELARLALDGELDLASMVTREIALEEVEDAFRDLERGNGIRSVIRFP
jgi:S-(hydroxymethyl)mycothiol dehydrogenase